jgi:DNA-binding MarR family transcriptional regulator/GNAT superfamily N-acetyltransferase
VTSHPANSRPVPAGVVAAVRRFNRFYTARARLLGQRHQGSPFTLAEVRLLFELAHRPQCTAAELCQDLGLDAGYVSRVLAGFRRRRLVARRASPTDKRESILTMTAKGRAAFATLDRGAAAEVRELLAPLPDGDRRRVADAMQAIEAALDGREPSPLPTAVSPTPPSAAHGAVILRDPRPGDLGWVIERHGALYAAEYGYDARFEGLVAGVIGEFVTTFDPSCERCWIAERDGERLGSVFLVRKDATTAKLRLLLVEPTARGLGLGRTLVEACTAFARACGYAAIELWTQSELVAARAIYVREGYELVASEPHAMFGKHCVAETWLKQITTTASEG